MTMPTSSAYDSMLPVQFEAPLQNPAPGGLYPHVLWTEVSADEPSRHLTGVQVRPAGNFPGEQVGIWDAPWCPVPALDGEPRKEGDRLAGLDAFDPVVVWAYDECDLTAPSQAEVQQRAMQALRMRESVVVARQFAERLKLDAADLGATPAVADVVAALALLEGEFAKANALGYIHASPEWLPVLASAQLIARSGTRWATPGGHAVIFDGGYVDGLDDIIVATSAPLFGWRDQVVLRTAIDERHNIFAAVAERTVLVGYEHLIAAVQITEPAP